MNARSEDVEMPVVRIVRRIACCGVAVSLLAACAKPHVVDDGLADAAGPTTEFSMEDQSATFTVYFSNGLSARDRFMVEWLFPDGKIYLRKPLGRDSEMHDRVQTRLPIQGKSPARHPGRWQVRLWWGDDALVERSFEILPAAATPMSAAAGFQGLASCGPSQWNDPVISARRSALVSSRVPGAWTGTELLEAAGATYSRAVLLTGCAPS